MELFDYEKMQGTTAGWAFIVACENIRKTGEIANACKRDDGKHEVVLTINGVGCSFQTIIDRMEEQLDWQIGKAAAALVDAHFDRLRNRVNAMLDEFEVAVKDSFNQQG